MTALWHNQAHMPSVLGRTRRIVRGEGAYVFDASGRRLLDVPAGLWFANIGHARPEMAEVVARQIRELETYPVFGEFANPRAEELAERLAALVPVERAKIFFGSGGGEAAETAIKLVRRYWQIAGRPERQAIVTLQGGYHGLHGLGTSVVGVPAFREGYGELVPGNLQVPAMNLSALAELLAVHGERIAAVVCEPVMGGGAGVVPPPEGYLSGVQDQCRKHGVLLVLDEVITGLGRAGALFAAERFGLRPDILLLAKGLTSGYLPLGAAVVGWRVAEPFWADGSPHVFRHGITYSGHAAACAAALTNLDILEREALVERVRGLERRIFDALSPLRAHPLIADVRGGVGLLAGVAFRDHDVAEAVAAATAEHGMLMRVTGGNALQISPPFVVPETALLEDLPRAIERALSTILARSP